MALPLRGDVCPLNFSVSVPILWQSGQTDHQDTL